MKTSTILHEVSPEQITNLFAGLQSQLNDLKANFQPKEPKEYLTRSEVSKMLKVDLSTLHNWVKKDKLKPHGIGNRVYFLRSEVEAALTPIR
jgi:excisionase family DNA binding protein